MSQARPRDLTGFVDSSAKFDQLTVLKEQRLKRFADDPVDLSMLQLFNEVHRQNWPVDRVSFCDSHHFRASR